MTERSIPSFTTEDLTTGTPLSTVEEIREHGPGSIVALVRDNYGFVHADLYENYSAETWVLRDPEENRDEWTHTAENLLTIANLRDHRQVISLVKNGDYSEHRRLHSEDELRATGHGAAVVRIDDDGSADEPFRNFGGWMYAPDADYTYSHAHLATLARDSGGVALIWDPPASQSESPFRSKRDVVSTQV